MNKVILNPSNYTEKYISYLNLCFPDWGQRKRYNWMFDRQVGPHKADILLLKNENDEIIAGSGITYRTIKSLKGNILNIGIFSGSWTLPKARGRGCFTQIIQEFIKLCDSKGVDYLTAFVTESNASYRRFKSIGSEILQADNIFSDLSITYNCKNREILMVENDDDMLYQYYIENLTINSGFYYTKNEFIKQYILRDVEVYSLKIENSKYLIEENESTVRILYQSNFDIEHLKNLSNWSKIHKNKKIMFFLTEKQKIEVCKKNQFNCVNGFFTINRIGSKDLDINIDFESLTINLADKM